LPSIAGTVFPAALLSAERIANNVPAMHVTIRKFSADILARDRTRVGKPGADAGHLPIAGHIMRSAVRLPRIGILPPMVASVGSPGDAAPA
jgi:hypothetical protein